MEKIIGSKNEFAIGIDVQKYLPSLWGRSCIWIKNYQLGDFDDLNILGPFLQSIMRLAKNSEDLWLDELNGLDCTDIFQKINPYFENPDDFYDLTREQQNEYLKFDRFLFEFGENFDQILLKPVVRYNMCKLIWLATPIGIVKSTKPPVIQCQEIHVEKIQDVYKELCDGIPDEYWPKLIEKYSSSWSKKKS